MPAAFITVLPGPSSAAFWLAAVLGLLVLLLAVKSWRQARTIRRLRRKLARPSATDRRTDTTAAGAPVNAADVAARAVDTFDQQLEQAVLQVDQQQQPAAVVLWVHLERTGASAKAGQRGVDPQVKAAAQHLLDSAGHQVLASRLDGDDLLLLVPGNLDSACRIAAGLCSALAGPAAATARGQRAVHCAVGLAAYPMHGARGRLLAHAGLAARAAQRSGGGGYMVFAPPMAEDQREQASLLADLRVAAGLGQFELVYQPKVAAGSLQVTGVEALLRWHHPLRGIVSPAVFIPMAERSGLIGAIGDWVMADACRQCAAWRAQGLHLPVAINLSAYQMRQHDLADRIDAALQRHGLQAGDLTLEITESVAVEDTDIIRRSFERLSDLGVQVSVDDYGVGQTSLGSLQQLLVSELKVDASLVRDLADRPDVRGIVDAMVRLAHALSLKVVAMGVETEVQRDRLVQLGCDELQGFLFAKPMSAPGVAQWARRDPVAVPRAVAGSVTQCSDSTAAVDLTG